MIYPLKNLATVVAAAWYGFYESRTAVQTLSAHCSQVSYLIMSDIYRSVQNGNLATTVSDGRQTFLLLTISSPDKLDSK